MTGPEFAFFYRTGLFDGWEDDYDDGLFGVLHGVLVDTLIGAFDRVENELAKCFINYLNACRMLSHAQSRCRMPHVALRMRACERMRACMRHRVPICRHSVRDPWVPICRS